MAVVHSDSAIIIIVYLLMVFILCYVIDVWRERRKSHVT